MSLHGLNGSTSCFNNSEKSKLTPGWRQSNQANFTVKIRRTGPCGYRTPSSQTPLVFLPTLPICNKLHASFSESVKYWTHLWPLWIPRLFSNKWPATFYSRGKSWTINLQQWEVFSKCITNKLIFVGYPSSTGRISLFKTHHESAVLLAYICEDNKKKRQLTPNSIKTNSHPQATQCLDARMKNLQAEQLARIAKGPKGTGGRKCQEALSSARFKPNPEKRWSWMV